MGMLLHRQRNRVGVTTTSTLIPDKVEPTEEVKVEEPEVEDEETEEETKTMPNANGEKTVQDVFNTLNEEQKKRALSGFPKQIQDGLSRYESRLISCF